MYIVKNAGKIAYFRRFSRDGWSCKSSFNLVNWYRAIIFGLKKKLNKLNSDDLNSIYYGLIAIMLCYFAVDQLTTNRIFNSLLVLLISGIKIYQDKQEGEIEIEYE